MLIEATGQWHTALDPTTGRFTFVDPLGYGRVLRGVSMTGMESGTPGDASGAGYWMYDPKGNGTAQQILENVVTALDQTWNPGIVRVPICGSAWATPYMVHDWSGSNIMNYRDWVDVVVKKERALGRVVIIDLHLWQIAPLSSAPSGQKRVNDQTGQPYTGRVDGCIGYQELNEKHTCATVDWVQNDPNNWTCTVANAEGITLQNAHFNREHIAKMWAQIAARYKSDSGVFFELFNEPYEHVDNGAAFGTAALAENKVFPPEDQYDWDMWTTVMDRWLKAVRDEGGADNVVLINGLMWGYTFHGPIANPDKYMPWVKQGTKNIAYAFHPYQHGTCCGDVGVDKDLSKDDPYHLTYCRYFQNGTPSAPAPWFSYLPSSLPGRPGDLRPHRLRAHASHGHAALPLERQRVQPERWLGPVRRPARRVRAHEQGTMRRRRSRLARRRRLVPLRAAHDQVRSRDRHRVRLVRLQLAVRERADGLLGHPRHLLHRVGAVAAEQRRHPEHGLVLVPGHQRGLPEPEQPLPHRLQGVPQPLRLRESHGPAHALGRPRRVREHAQARERTRQQVAGQSRVRALVGEVRA